MNILKKLYAEFEEASMETPLNTEKLSVLVERIEFYEKLLNGVYATDN